VESSRDSLINTTETVPLSQTLINQITSIQSSNIESHIILYEQEPPLAEAYKEVIQREYENCIVVGRSYDILALLSTTKCHILVTDLPSPGQSDGFEVIKTIREDLKLTFPIVVLTNFVSESLIDCAYTLGANAYLVKTEIEATHLERIIRRFSNPFVRFYLSLSIFLSNRF